MEIIIRHAGDTWRVLGQNGVRNGDGQGQKEVHCHLASTTRLQQQPNGSRPVEIYDWVDYQNIIAAALKAGDKT